MMSALRITNFVEIGPLLVIGPRLRDEFLPFPEDSTFGWGLGIRWMARALAGQARYGIADSAALVHLNPMGGEYDTFEAERFLDQAFAETGITSVYKTTRTYKTLRPWQA